jgi:signal transduction histidine kinase
VKLARPRIRTVLVFVNLLILLLPLAGIQALRLYESALVRQTEDSLLVLGSYVREHFADELVQDLGNGASLAGYGRPVLPAFEEPASQAAEPYAPIEARLDLATQPVLPLAEDAQATTLAAESHALAAGARLNPLLRSSQRHTLTGIRIVDAQGLVVASSRGELGESLLHRDEVRRALDGEPVSLLRERTTEQPQPALETISRGSRIRVFVSLPVIRDGRVLGAVVLSRTPLDLSKALYENRHLLFGYAATLLLVALLVSILTATTISRPIAALIRQTEEVQAGRSVEPLARPGSQELDHLSRAVATMARTLRDRSDYIGAFARSVSHEFKTPLATIHATMELLRDHFETMDSAERERFLGMIDAEARRLEALVGRLLELARADTARPPETGADAAAVAALVVARFAELGLDVELAAPPEAHTFVGAPPEALDAILANLLENARQHGGAGVHVRVRLATTPEAAHIEVADDGRGVSPGNLDRAFDAFFTTARERGGTGLGLSIVKSLVESVGGRVTLVSLGENKGTTVRVDLPRARASG